MFLYVELFKALAKLLIFAARVQDIFGPSKIKEGGFSRIRCRVTGEAAWLDSFHNS